MSHRRKNAHPTSKLRRSGSTSVADSSSLSASGTGPRAQPLTDSAQMVSQAEDLAIHRDNAEPVSSPSATTFTSAAALPTPLIPDAGVASTVPSQLALPPDLWEDFQALQAATHLDTASLIRRLIHQYGKGGSQAESERPSSATDTDTTICAEDHASSPGGGGDSQTPFYGEPAGYLGRSMTPMLAASDFMSPAHDDEDCLILDLSSGSRDVQHSPATVPASGNARTEYPEEAEDSVERPLDLTVSKAKEFSQRGEMVFDKAPDAHQTPSSAILLSALSSQGMMLHAAAASAHPREAHSALAELTPTPRPVSSSLFNLSELPLVGQRVSSVAQTEHRNKLSVSSSSSSSSSSKYSEEMQQNKQKIVQQFLSLPSGHLQASDVHPKTMGHQEKQECVLKVTHGSAESFRHLGVSSAAPYLASSTSSAKCVDHSQPAPDAASVPVPMQLPTVTSLEFPEVKAVGRKGAGGQEEALGQSAVTMTLSSLPTSASAILLDVSSGGLVAGAGAGVSTLNIPLMATGAGGLVAIPFLHTLPEAFAAAAAAAAINQEPVPPASTPTSLSQHSPPSSLSVNDLPPPPPYSAAVAASAHPKKYKAKLGRPRGQPKVQKIVPKDMKLLTENTLFPGVYTSILKLPWSKRSRGKSSVKIKDVIGKSSNSTAKGSQEQAAVSEHGEPGEVTATSLHRQHPREAPACPSSSSDAAAFRVLPMPVLVPDQTSTTTTVLPSSSSSSASSVMMLYQNSVMSEGGKPTRKRGRPPKLPVLSQLLTENLPYAERPPEDDQPMPMDTGSFSLIPLAAHPAFEGSAVAFPTNALDPSVSGLAPEQIAGIKQEPMEVGEAGVSKLFSLVPAVLERKGGPGHPHHDLQNHQPLKQEPHDVSMTMKSADVKEAEKRQAEARHEVKTGDARSAKLGGGTARNTDAKDSDGQLYGCPEVSERENGEKRDSADSFKDSETRFHMLANQLGLEIGSPYHTSLVYGQSPTAAAKNFLYQPVLESSHTMVEYKPCRRQLNNLIKPNDDCVYTSFRIRPRNSGRRGGKRGGKRRGLGSKYSTSKSPNQKSADPEDLGGGKDSYYKEGSDDGRSGSGSAVITERIPGAGEVPQRLYQDLYHCKVCKELLPVDNSLPHTCAAPRSPPMCSCDVCGTVFLSSASHPDGPALPKMCEDCSRKAQPHPSPVSAEENSQDQGYSDGFACQPCGVHFVNISDYIQHRRTAHLEKMSRLSRKTHTLRTLPCPARGCPRLFHMHAELSRHLANDHPEEGAQAGVGSSVEGGYATSTPSPSQQESYQDVDVETIPDKETENAEEDLAQFPCFQEDCAQRFSTAFQLLEHVQACHEGVTHWPCPLSGCSRHFGSERHLRVHLLMHKDEKPLRCPFCQYRCRQKNALHWHMRKHPESAGQYRKFAGMSMDS